MNHRLTKLIGYLFKLSLFSIVFSSTFFNHDAIESNQYLLDDINPNVLDTINHFSIFFDQSHEMPYGTFPFKDIDYISGLDTIGTISQFIFKKGDYKFRDLLLSLASLNKTHLEFKYIGNIRSFTPLYIPLINSEIHKDTYGSLSGDSYLQNHMISINKETSRRIFKSSILYHDENPYLPISYKYYSSDSTTFNTRKSKSILWGFSNDQILNDYLSLQVSSKNMYSNIVKYHTIIENSESASYNKNIYFTGVNSLELKYRKGKFFFSPIISSLNYYMSVEKPILEETSNLSISKYYIGGRGRLSGDENEIYFNFFLDKLTFNFQGQKSVYLNLKPALHLKLKLTDKLNFQCRYNKKDGFLDYDLIRTLILYDNMEFLLSRRIRKLNIEFGLGYVSNLVSQNYLESNIETDRYKYLNIHLSYLSHYFDFSLSSKKFISINYNDKYNPWINDYIKYHIALKYPPKNKPYILFASIEGNYILYEKGGVYVNELPLLRYSDENTRTAQHFINFQLGLKLQNFTLSYNNITNNGNDFSVDDNYSDVGDAFSLPQYNVFSSELSVFHYLRVSWTFLD